MNAPYTFDLMGGKAVMDAGFTAEDLDKLTGDIFPADPREREAAARRVAIFKAKQGAPEERLARLERGFLNRKEERDAKKSVRARIRRYHRIVDGELFARIQKRRIKKKRGNQARKVNRVCT